MSFPKTRTVKAGRLMIGGGFPVSVQTMWKEPLRPFGASELNRIASLEALGCELLRFSVPDGEAAGLIGELAAKIQLPLVADIHFDYRLAIECLDYPLAKIRINPGNIGAPWKVEEVVRKAQAKNVALRVGVNAGSLPKKLQAEPNRARAMLEAAELEMEILEKLGFHQVVFSLKSSRVEETVESNRLFASKYDYPLHVGVTEAGPLIQGVVKNTLALSELLRSGVGDTVRVSLSDTPENEIIAGRSILRSVGIRKTGVEIVSCPTCSRNVFDVKAFYEHVKDFIQILNKPITIALMGCPVNGPGEARQADLGVTGAGGKAVFFKKGHVIRRVEMERAVEVFKEEVEKIE